MAGLPQSTHLHPHLEEPVCLSSSWGNPSGEEKLSSVTPGKIFNLIIAVYIAGQSTPQVTKQNLHLPAHPVFASTQWYSTAGLDILSS